MTPTFSVISQEVFNTTSLVFVITLTLGYFVFVRNRNLPPGPVKLPTIGNLWWIILQRLRGKRIALAVKEYWSKTGAELFHLSFLNINIVFFNGYDTIHEAFVKRADDFSHRPQWLVERVRPEHGIVFSNGHEWKSMRRFILVALKEFGVGKTRLEEKIMQEIDTATHIFLQNNGQPRSYRNLIAMVILNVMYGICFGTRLEYGSSLMTTMKEKLDVLLRPENSLDPTSWMPKIIWKLVGNEKRYKYNALEEERATFEWLYRHIDEQIEHHRATVDPDNPRDFIDLFLINEKHENDTQFNFTRRRLYEAIVDLFIAGAETTSISIDWTILYLQEFPEIQRLCQEEITQKCGSRQITYADRSNLPYTEATLMEIQRVTNVAEFSVSHTNLLQTRFHGYKIPANSLLHATFLTSHMDPKYWHRPKIFNPLRHIKDGKIVKNKAFIPFSIGPRMCLGDMLAKMELFVIVTNLLQRFSFEKEQPGLRHSLQSVVDQLTTSPLPYKSRMIKRD